MGYLRSSRGLNKRLGFMIKDWLDSDMSPSEVPALCGEQIRYYAEEVREETGDDATCLIMGFEGEDLMRPLMGPNFGDSAETETGESPRISREISAPRFPKAVGSEDIGSSSVL
jgi:hypothetical protein